MLSNTYRAVYAMYRLNEPTCSLFASWPKRFGVGSDPPYSPYAAGQQTVRLRDTRSLHSESEKCLLEHNRKRLRIVWEADSFLSQRRGFKFLLVKNDKAPQTVLNGYVCTSNSRCLL
jgi:hypothetical protein